MTASPDTAVAFTVYSFPGRRTVPLEADTVEAAEHEVEELVDIPKALRPACFEWRDCGSGRMLVVSGKKGRPYGHYWLRPTEENR